MINGLFHVGSLTKGGLLILQSSAMERVLSHDSISL